jgi:hypothetical protein
MTTRRRSARAGRTSAAHASQRPWGWIAVAGLLAAGLIGLGIYALNLNSDLDDADAQIASQQGQIDQAQETGVDIVASAQAAYDDLSAQLGAAQEDASQAADEAAEAQDQAEQAAAEAEGTVDEVQKETDAAQAKAERRHVRAIVPVGVRVGIQRHDGPRERRRGRRGAAVAPAAVRACARLRARCVGGLLDLPVDVDLRTRVAARRLGVVLERARVGRGRGAGERARP